MTRIHRRVTVKVMNVVVLMVAGYGYLDHRLVPHVQVEVLVGTSRLMVLKGVLRYVLVLAEGVFRYVLVLTEGMFR